ERDTRETPLTLMKPLAPLANRTSAALASSAVTLRTVPSASGRSRTKVSRRPDSEAMSPKVHSRKSSRYEVIACNMSPSCWRSDPRGDAHHVKPGYLTQHCAIVVTPPANAVLARNTLGIVLVAADDGDHLEVWSCLEGGDVDTGTEAGTDDADAQSAINAGGH